MRSLLVEEALRQCWTMAWGDVARELEQEVSVGGAMGVMKKMMGFMQQVCGAGFRAWVEQADVAEDTLVRDGRTLRFKCVSPKEFVTPCGPITVVRRLFQADRGGPYRAVHARRVRPASSMRYRGRPGSAKACPRSSRRAPWSGRRSPRRKRPSS